MKRKGKKGGRMKLKGELEWKEENMEIFWHAGEATSRQNRVLLELEVFIL